MYAKNFPHLFSLYQQFDNFEVIVKTILLHFGHLFQLDVLDSESKKGSQGSYAALFKRCINKLEGLYTVGEVVARLCEVLQENKEIKASLLEEFIFVPSVGQRESNQLGFLEKMATETLHMSEPVTFVDMLRVLSGLKHLADKSSFPSVYVVDLSHATYLPMDKIKKAHQALLINFNRDVNEVAKWGVVDLRAHSNLRLFCETPLTEPEKKRLEECLQITAPIEYLGAEANHLPSTGYTAISWLDIHITKAWSFDLTGDFAALMDAYAFVQLGGDVRSLIYTLKQEEVITFCKPSFRHIASSTFSDDRNVRGIATNEFEGGRAITLIAAAAMLGRIRDEPFRPGDVGAVVKIYHRRGLSNQSIKKYLYEAFKTLPPAFSATMSRHNAPKLLTESDKEISLNVPLDINVHALNNTHATVCRETHTSDKWLMNLPDLAPRGKDNLQEYVAVLMVYTLLRAKAKKRVIGIHLPSNFQLNAHEIRSVLDILKENAYITEFKINDNASLETIHNQLVPTFARNRWLMEKGYRPPMTDNYWKQAARFWMLHLKEHPQVLSPTDDHTFFKRCVLEMGVQGLNAVLAYLADDGVREQLEVIYGNQNPSFYAACMPKDIKDYLSTLIAYLRQPESYFPFNEFGISYQPGNDVLFIELLGQINQLQRFEKITLTDFLQSSVENCELFLKTLIQHADEKNWVGLVIIPELEDKTNTTRALVVLRQMYGFLNDVMLRNRHELSNHNLLKRIADISNVEADLSVVEALKPSPKSVLVSDGDDNVTLDAALANIDRESWPLRKGNFGQMQIQQQEQIEQMRQIQQEQQQVTLNNHEAAVAEELVDYKNIDRLLGKFYQKFGRENKIWRQSASLKSSEESDLQGFFHTWISANPFIGASQVIRKMTQDAAKMLVRKHRLLSSGLSIEHLPKGFYTQRSKDGDMILCYSADQGYVSAPTALTLSLDVQIPEAHAWSGDFRQLDLPRYKTRIAALESIDWQNIILFSQLQPVRDYTEDFKEFCRVNRLDVETLPHKDKCIRLWPIFLQVWQYKGMDGLMSFFEKKDIELRLNLKDASKLLLKNQSADLSAWYLEQSITEASFSALGQVFHWFGDKGLQLFLAKLRQIQMALGAEFFNHFNTCILQRTANFNCFITEKFFSTMDEMIRTLKPRDSEHKRQLWSALLFKHMDAVSWDNVDTLWHGFALFLQDIDQLGLKLFGHEFDEIPPENMLVCMDRILASLKCIPDESLQQRFLNQLPRIDRTHGGVHYALQYEGFKFFENELELRGFNHGSPTYAPDLKFLYQWNAPDAALKMKRSIACQRQFTHENYPILIEELGNRELASKHALIWLLHTDHHDLSIQESLQALRALPPRFQRMVAEHLHNAVERLDNRQIKVSFLAMQAFATYLNENPGSTVRDLFENYQQGTVLEAVSLLHGAKRMSNNSLAQLLKLLRDGIKSPNYWRCEGYKLATLFGVDTPDGLEMFFKATDGLLEVVKAELRLLITQLLSIDFAASDLNALTSPSNWKDLLVAIAEMKQHPANTGIYRVQLMEKLNARYLNFKYSKTGAFRALTTKAEDAPTGLGFFVDHEERLWNFMKAHLAIPSTAPAEDALQPIVRFLKRLQLNRTYLNEIEPLLASLEKTPHGHYWSAHYFYQLLQALQPKNEQTSFPISLLKVILQEEMISAKPLDNVTEAFPSGLVGPLQVILQNTVFDRPQQALLCQIALRELNWMGSVELMQQIIATLSLSEHAMSRDYALNILTRSKSHDDLAKCFEDCQWLLKRSSPHVVINSVWTKSAALWLKAISVSPREKDLFLNIKFQFRDSAERQSLVLHIMAWSTLSTGLKSSQVQMHELSTKALKLAQRLGEMSLADLVALAHCYPKQPSPGADDILRMLKAHLNDKQTSWPIKLSTFLQRPYPEARADYAVIAATREADLRRLITATQVSNGSHREGISTNNRVELTLVFVHLKQLECGQEMIRGLDKPILEMSQAELSHAFKALSMQSLEARHNALVRAELWAVLFEVMGRTTRKYPHLAQQFALIANDMCIDANSRVLQLATGEGKSHFVAMRAARHAGCGKVVDVCTAKRTLAERDLLDDYESFYHYLGIKTAYIHPKSSHAEYMDSQIHYSTMGDLSLFLDDQSYTGQPIAISRDNRVLLMDEFDFIRYEEGRKTEYNYARPTGKTPKQMIWFYQLINAFYLQNSERIISQDNGKITRSVLHKFATALRNEASDNEEKEGLIKQILRDPLQLVQWLQSAHEAHELQWGINFTVREENIVVGDEIYPMREIIPLSTDNQPMAGSSFSQGVHQLTAVRLNTEASRKHQAQNFHIHPESIIISSQVAAQRIQELWGQWEGFSGTISPAQATSLYKEQQTQVLHVPTNQRDLREWHKVCFYKNEHERFNALVVQIRQCMSQNQSILFSCKNDQQVTQLNERLSKALSKDELKNFIFFTNEEHRSASDVLDEKREKENRQGGKKQNGICLVASGFGRGDNVDVEAVFLFNVNDTNDLLQKGGRTARNGAAGEVFQFYLIAELKSEEKALQATLQDMSIPVPMALAAVPGENEDEKTFERVMLLREYVFSLQNEAHQGYHQAIAEYSAWGMHCLGQLDDLEQRSSLMTLFSYHLKHLEKRWIDISSEQGSNNQEKVEKIREVLVSKTKDFSRGYTEIIGHDVTPAFQLSRAQKVSIELVVVTPPHPSDVDVAVASICSALARFHDLKLSNANVNAMPNWLAILAGNKERLQQFANGISKYDSAHKVAGALYIASEQVRVPSELWQNLRINGMNKDGAQGIFTGVSDAVRIAFDDAMNALLPSLQTQTVSYLMRPRLTSYEQSIASVLPVLNYLATFDPHAQHHFGYDYLAGLDRLISEAFPKMTPSDVLSLRLTNMPVMSLSYLDGLWGIAMRYTSNAEDLNSVLQMLARAVAVEPECRFRMLAKWEPLVKDLPQARALSFLKHFCKLMTQFVEGMDWDVFEALLSQTHEWWNKGGEHDYQDDMLKLWENLDGSSENIHALSNFIKWAMLQGGKSWYQLVSISLSIAPKVLSAHKEQLKALWTEVLNLEPTKKHLKIAQFKLCTAALVDLYNIMATLEMSTQSRMLPKILALEAPQLKRMLMLVHHNREVFAENTNVFTAILDYMCTPRKHLPRMEQLSQLLLQSIDYKIDHPDGSDYLIRILGGARSRLVSITDEKFELLMVFMQENLATLFKHRELLPVILSYVCDDRISLKCTQLLSIIALHCIKYTESHPSITFEDLLVGISRFKYKSEAELTILIAMLTECPEQTVEPLFDGAVSHLATLSEQTRELRKKSIQHFYSVAKAQKGVPANMFRNERIQSWFAQTLPEARQQRTTLMHLLHHDVMTTGKTNNAAYAHHDYQWSDATNQAFLTLGFERYVQHTKSILEKKVSKKGFENVRDLTVVQQTSLLQLADEMACIGKPRPGPLVSASSLGHLEVEMRSLIKKYDASWFKSRDRQVQWAAFKTNIQQVASTCPAGKTTYEAVLEALSQAKFEAIKSDRQYDNRHSSKMNRGGSSRYYTTLNKMQDMVLRHWATDTPALQSLQVYQQFSKKELMTLIPLFDDRLCEYNVTKYLKATPYGWQEKQPFGSQDRYAIRQLMGVLHHFKAGEKNAAHLNVLIVEMKATFKSLPGHLKTLAKEVLSRGEAWKEHLSRLEERQRLDVDHLGMSCR